MKVPLMQKVYLMAAKVNLKILILFEPEQIQGLQPYLFEPECASQSSCDDARSHDFFEGDVESV